ncbi:MAG: glycosyltransferase [bacterium]|nr:glycosyltransferase [bacterium]
MKARLFQSTQAVISRATTYSVPIQCVPTLIDGSTSNAGQGIIPYPAQEDLPENGKLQPFSLICTCRNESDSIILWLDSIASQTIPPSELVIYDAASDDGTAETIETYFKNKMPAVSLNLIKGERCSIAQGRNRAIAVASHENLLLTDAGCIIDSHWCEFMMRGFNYQFNKATPCTEIYPRTDQTEIVMGFYNLQGTDSLASDLFRIITPALTSINPATFLPSARSLGLKKYIWQEVGGFPEHLYRAGEDTLFDLKIKELNAATVFVPQAVVYWHPPTRLYQALRSIFSYSFGDGETMRLGTKDYLRHVRDTALMLILILVIATSCIKTLSAYILVTSCGLFLAFSWRYIASTFSLARKRGITRQNAFVAPFFLRPVMAAGFILGVTRKTLKGIKSKSGFEAVVV